MATQILATASTAADSADIAVTTDTPFSLKGVTGGEAYVTILLKDDAAAYNIVGSLTSHAPATVISAPGTYRFTRRAGATCGVFSG
jgi:hypothetical protein